MLMLQCWPTYFLTLPVHAWLHHWLLTVDKSKCRYHILLLTWNDMHLNLINIFVLPLQHLVIFHSILHTAFSITRKWILCTSCYVLESIFVMEQVAVFITHSEFTNMLVPNLNTYKFKRIKHYICLPYSTSLQ